MEARHRRRGIAIITDPQESAAAVGLRYVSDQRPGIQRLKSGANFRYVDADGKTVRDKSTLQRIRSLVLPPAWTKVWITSISNGHLQATGHDARGRKQYRYHPRWREVRDDSKFNRMILFGEALPKIRAQVRRDLKLPGLRREKILATIVRLLETTYMRVGNEEYARENKSYGLTTLRNRHVQIRGTKIRLQFKGKRARQFNIELQDPQLARIVKKCQELPGQELFQYLNEQGEPQIVTSEDVNDYLREISGEEFTAKDFRTWAGTMLAARALGTCADCDGVPRTKKFLTQAVETVAEQLGNTPTICRKCYVHPAIFNAFHDGSLMQLVNSREQELKRKTIKLSSEEKCVLLVLKRHARQQTTPLATQLKRSLRSVKKNGTARRSRQIKPAPAG